MDNNLTKICIWTIVACVIIVLSTVSYETFTYPEDPIAQRITECKKFHFAKQRKYCLEKILDE